MMIATNWGVFEIGERAKEFIDPDDTRELQVRARDDKHLNALRAQIPMLGANVYLDGIADFPWRAYISRDALGHGLAALVQGVDYERFKEGAQGDPKLHNLLSRMWSVWLQLYPKGSRYMQQTVTETPVRESSAPYPTASSQVRDLEMIVLESVIFPEEFFDGANVTYTAYNGDHRRMRITGEVFELALLVLRHETGEWELSLDDITDDALEAAQIIDQYII